MQLKSENWPRNYDPDREGSLYVQNEISIKASPKYVWAWLTRASSWRNWCSFTEPIRIHNRSGNDLELGAIFHWKKDGMSVKSKVFEFEFQKHIGWETTFYGIQGSCQRFTLEKSPIGTRLRLEEVQSVFFPLFLLNNAKIQYRVNQHWLELLKDQAESERMPANPK